VSACVPPSGPPMLMFHSSIKETGTVACRACCDLEADRRLCLTGTPVQNKLDDLFALIKFLRLEPFTDKAIWTEYIGTPVKFGQAIGIARLQTIMKTITLRRTKESRTENGQKILALPERVDELRLLKFGPEEQAIYDQYFQESKSEFTELSRKNEIMKNYVGILQKILRLRQICDHYELVKDKGAGVAQSWDDLVAAITQEGLTPERAAAVFAILRESASAQCTECGVDLGGAPAEALGGAPAAADECAPPTAKRGRKSKAVATRPNSPAPCRPILTRCQHLFCPGCFRTAVFPEWPHAPADTRRQCAACPAALGVGDAVEVSPEAAPADAPAKKKGAKKERRQKGVVAAETFVASTKIKALMGDLIASSRANPHSANYDPGSLEIQATDQDGVIEPPIKTIVLCVLCRRVRGRVLTPAQLAVDDDAGQDRGRARAREHPVRAPRRHDAPGGARARDGHAQGGPIVRDPARQPQGRRRGPEPDVGVAGVPDGPVLEPGRRTPGRRPCGELPPVAAWGCSADGNCSTGSARRARCSRTSS
jgi:SWI/SNF-related matrix-associated actin-dependent regulator of chromatin subfamily A3